MQCNAVPVKYTCLKICLIVYIYIWYWLTYSSITYKSHCNCIQIWTFGEKFIKQIYIMWRTLSTQWVTVKVWPNYQQKTSWYSLMGQVAGSSTNRSCFNQSNVTKNAIKYKLTTKCADQFCVLRRERFTGLLLEKCGKAIYGIHAC